MRSVEYDEDDDGFMFTRAKARKSRPSASKITSVPEHSLNEKENGRPRAANEAVHTNDGPDPTELLKKRRRKLSFSTPDVRAEKPVRRSKRLSDEAERRDGSPQHIGRRKKEADMGNMKKPQVIKRPPEHQNTPRPPQVELNEDRSATKIALPFADTPVIRKNKAMREARGGVGERRSSLGLRGRRASSLIDSCNSSGKGCTSR